MHSVRDWFRHRRPPTGYEEKEEESSDEEEPQAVSETGKIRESNCRFLPVSYEPPQLTCLRISNSTTVS